MEIKPDGVLPIPKCLGKIVCPTYFKSNCLFREDCEAVYVNTHPTMIFKRIISKGFDVLIIPIGFCDKLLEREI